MKKILEKIILFQILLVGAHVMLTHTYASPTPNSVSSWEISGAMAARNAKKSFTATVRWHQIGPQQYQIRFIGPIGSGAVLISKINGVVTFQDGAKKMVHKSDEQLLEKTTGVRLPIHSLYFWVRGIPSPHFGSQKTSIQKYPDGHIRILKQGNYTLEYGQYMTVKGIDLPSKIRLEGSNINLKFVIKQWQINL